MLQNNNACYGIQAGVEYLSKFKNIIHSYTHTLIVSSLLIKKETLICYYQLTFPSSPRESIIYQVSMNWRLQLISPFRSSKWGSECFLPISAKDRTRGIRLLNFFSFWWWCLFRRASLTFSLMDSSSWPEAIMLSKTIST